MADVNSNQNNKKNPSSFIGDFSDSMSNHFPDIDGNIAVGVSGGADSMALCFALSEYFKDVPSVTIYALSVDHGLRRESADEVQHVARQLSNLPNVYHHVLTWAHETTPEARIQEKAREARYSLMKEYMRERGINLLFLGHHIDDQAETFLFRLSKGSGLDGLSCMSVAQDMGADITFCRPMLGLKKEDMISFCDDRGVGFIDDPSNYCDNYARVRLRKSRDLLAEEGLSSKRLFVASKRFFRARKALEQLSNSAYDECFLESDASCIVFKLSSLISNPEEIVLRVVLRAMSELKNDSGYGARLERVENLCADLVVQESFRKRTLGGIIFECKTKDDKFILSLE
ncbi:MAG: tRNA lysidine(34) synthetase TilS [Alphaproteobacteria bacterium]